ncbi:MAG: Uma2 family endonuclease [Cyanobacteria bacterium J06623_4]
MVQAPTKPITLEAFLQQPETKPASEYIDGHIIQKPMPKAEHSVIQTDLAIAINAKLKPEKKGRALTELRCTFEGRSIVPDITVLPWANLPRQENGRVSGDLYAAPDWIIEILSEGQSQTKVVKKIFHSLEHGTQIGWLIDPSEDCVFGYTPDLKTKLYENPEQSLPVPDFAKDFQLTVGELVSWLYE